MEKRVKNKKSARETMMTFTSSKLKKLNPEQRVGKGHK